MRSIKFITIITISLITLGLLLALPGCCKKCCSPSIEVGLCEPPGNPQWGCLGCGNKMEIWTWDPITLFPSKPNVQFTGYQLKVLRPYLPKVEVTNYSDVEVRGVTVAFYWASFGFFDRGTPIGAVGVDLPPNSSEWVRGPWSFVLGTHEERHICLAARIFHPCDTELGNNYCWRNFLIVLIPWPLEIYEVPFRVDFQKIEGDIKIQINAPEGIRARVVARQAYVEAADPAQQKEIKGLANVKVKKGVPQELSLLIENAGAEYKEGDTFDITANAVQNGEMVSSFTVQCKVGK